MDKTVSTPNAPAAVGPYAQAVWAGDMLYLSGQIPLDPQTGSLVSENFSEQVRQVLQNIQAVLKAAGLTPAQVVKTTVYLTEINQFSTLNELYAEVFGAAPPARSCVEVSALPRGAQVEIEVTAYRG